MMFLSFLTRFYAAKVIAILVDFFVKICYIKEVVKEFTPSKLRHMANLHRSEILSCNYFDITIRNILLLC